MKNAHCCGVVLKKAPCCGISSFGVGLLVGFVLGVGGSGGLRGRGCGRWAMVDGKRLLDVGVE